MKLNKPFKPSICKICTFGFLGLISSVLAQEAFEASPSVNNRLKNPASTFIEAGVDSSVAPVANGGRSEGSQGLKIESSNIGYSFSSGASDFDFGSEITPPLRDIENNTLTLNEARDYWRLEPMRAGENLQIGGEIRIPVSADSPEFFYYSPHLERLIASHTGRIEIVWVTAIPDENGNFETLPESYTISRASSLLVREMYWTENDFEAPFVQIQKGLIQEVKIIYNRRISEKIPDSARVIPVGTEDPELITNRTIWYDSNLEMLRAYNREGMVLIEYLGDPRPDAGQGVREHLGLEVIEIKKELSPSIVDSWIGEQIFPSDAPGSTLSDIDFSPVQVSPIGPLVARHFIESRTVYYGVEENNQPARIEFYWLKEGILNVEWPKYRNNYRLSWPNDVSDFAAVFARPKAGSSEEALEASYLDLLATNTPELVFQDDPVGEEAELDFRFRFTVTPGGDGFNRSLIRFNSGNKFWYARLYSATTDHLLSLDESGGVYDPDNPLDFHITRNVVVGQRLEPPHESLALGGYIDPASSTNYLEKAYIDPFAEGGIAGANAGAIIPVNALDGNRTLRVWWFKELAPPADRADLFTSVQVPEVVGDYTVSYPSNADKIVLASNDGSGPLDQYQKNGMIYSENDPSNIGYNPDEEHAVFRAGTVYALRDDLNHPDVSSEPFVLLLYTDEDDRPNMVVFEVVREDEVDKFIYPATAGTVLQAPWPLPEFSQPLENGVSRNREVTEPGQDPVANGPADENLKHYEKFTFQDRKGTTWVFRGPHDIEKDEAETPPEISMQYFYPTQEGFAFPDAVTGRDQAPEVGTIVPYLRPLDDDGNPIGDPINGTPLTITYIPKWPTLTPVLHYGETLAKPKFGLPQIFGQTSVQVVYQQSIAKDFQAAQNSVVLHDSTINRTVELGDFVGIESLPKTVPQSPSRGKVYFQGLPSHLQDRFFFDHSIGTQGALVFQGRFNDEPVGEDYLQPNNLSPEDIGQMQDLCNKEDPLKTEWDDLINNLKVVPIFRTRDPNFIVQTLTFEEWLDEQEYDNVIGQVAKPEYGPTELPEIVSPDQAVDGYFLSAVGGGSGYITIVSGNGKVNSPEGDPVQMHVIRVGEKLYRGELKPLVSSNPFSEKIAVQHTGDFAGQPNQFEFEWRKAPPQDGLPPSVFVFENRTLSGLLSNIEVSRNVSNLAGVLEWGGATLSDLPFPTPTAIYENGNDRTVPGLRIKGEVDFSDEITGGDRLEKVYLALKLSDQDGAALFLNGNEAIRYRAIDGEDSELSSSIPNDLKAFLTNGGDFQVFELPARDFRVDRSNHLEIHLNTSRAAGEASPFDLRVALQKKADRSSTNYSLVSKEESKKLHVVSGTGVDTLGDNYYIMRYRPLLADHPMVGTWSDWTNPALVEGWIKRVLAGINPFNQRITNFYENTVDTNTSLISGAGSRWEGDVALTLPAAKDAGLIEIYETVLNRGIKLSIGPDSDSDSGIDYAPANDALLLAVGYLNDLYVALGNEAFADAANPTVTFDAQALGTLGDAGLNQSFEETFRTTSTSRFAFQGQMATLLDETLALLRGRDDFLATSTRIAPVYNRIFWNYTRGIDAGELIYALNYNIRELNDAVADGKIDAEDAARLFPQAHGDAYGHYLMALKNYYRLLTDSDFTWGTRIEAVNVLGQPVSIDYFDERKFAGSAAALANTANQIVSLERRKAFQKSDDGWANLSDGRENERTNRTRYWGVDEWAARSGQGAYFNWVVANAILPDKDEKNEGIRKIDRTTVPELDAIAKAAEKIQIQLEAADARVNPLDLSNDSILFDLSPSELKDGKTHFEKIYERALTALNNAKSVFDRASESTRLLRSVENQSQNLVQVVDDEENTYMNDLIDIFGLPYPGDIGPGKIFKQGYEGPDLVRYMAIDRPFEIFTKDDLFSYDEGSKEFVLNVEDSDLIESLSGRNIFSINSVADEVEEEGDTIKYHLREDQGPYQLAEPEMGRRRSLGSLQTALNEVRLAEEQLYVGLSSMASDRSDLFSNLKSLEVEMEERLALKVADTTFNTAKFVYKEVIVAIQAIQDSLDLTEKTRQQIVGAAVQSLPVVVGLSNDVTAPARAAILAADIAASTPLTAADIAAQQVEAVSEFVFILAEKALEIATLTIEEKQYLRGQISQVQSLYGESLARTREVDALAVAYTRALEKYRTELSNGQTILANREVFRRRAAAAVQGYRTRDIAFRTFRSEALEEYQTLLDWASKYTFLAAQAYDYETGLLGTSDGRAFLGEIISSRALGVLDDRGNPTLSASVEGDPGLSGLLAKLKGDYDVVKGRLGFNNPETHGTTFSLRREYFRIPDGPEGDIAWQQKLESLVTKNLLTDADIATHAMQLGSENASSQPGFLINFPSTVEAGKNFFGKDLAPGDSDFSTTSFATKVHSLGVVLEGYQGMSPCLICQDGGGDPTHTHDDALSATPNVFLIPVGLDIMRTPPLGNGQSQRTFFVEDIAMPLPFDLGSVQSDSDTVQQVSDTLRTNFRSPRRHPAFRATDRVEFFFSNLSDDYTSSRLVGRSVWNSNWKLAIPAKELLADEQDGISRFIRTVKDIKLHLKTYSYSGN